MSRAFTLVDAATELPEVGATARVRLYASVGERYISSMQTRPSLSFKIKTEVFDSTGGSIWDDSSEGEEGSVFREALGDQYGHAVKPSGKAVATAIVQACNSGWETKQEKNASQSEAIAAEKAVLEAMGLLPEVAD